MNNSEQKRAEFMRDNGERLNKLGEKIGNAVYRATDMAVMAAAIYDTLNRISQDEELANIAGDGLGEIRNMARNLERELHFLGGALANARL